MDDKLYRLNTTYAVVDTLMCLAAIAAFGFSAWYFSKWWLNLFNLIPLGLFSRHTVILDVEKGEDDGRQE